MIELLFSCDLKIGGGLRYLDGDLISTISGTLEYHDGVSTSVEGPTRQYCPAVGDSTLGCITAVHADCYSINTGGSSLATLPHLSISSRTKHSPAKLKTGAVVHASVQRVNHLGEVALTCVEEKSCSRGLGVLNEGFITRCSSKLARNMLAYSLESALGILGRSVSFEITIGHNGRLWIATSTRQQAFLIVKALSSRLRRDPLIHTGFTPA